MHDIDTDKLNTWGFDDFFRDQVGENTTGIPARVAAEHRGGYEVWTSRGKQTARLSGRLARELKGEAYPGVGDWALLRQGDEDTAIIDAVLNRKTVFTRGAAGRRTQGQVVAANVDVVFAVTGLDGDFSVRRIERYLARIWASGANPVVVLNKADICEDLDTVTRETEAVCLGVPILVTSAEKGEGVYGLRSHVNEGETACFVGSSGAGKSTLINALLGEERMATSEVRSRDDRGTHTTTHRQLIVLPGGGLLIDTPGMRELRLTDDEGLEEVFSDIEQFAEKCRFRDCSHDTEPGCAVRAAVESGDLPADRLESYVKLLKEASAYELRHDEHARRSSERVWGQLYREAKLIRKWKGDG